MNLHGTIIDAEFDTVRNGDGIFAQPRGLHVEHEAHTPVGRLWKIGDPALNFQVLPFKCRVQGVVQ